MGEEARKWGKIMPGCLFVGGKERVGSWANIGWGLTDCDNRMRGHRWNASCSVVCRLRISEVNMVIIVKTGSGLTIHFPLNQELLGSSDMAKTL